ncbi:hypothetical protein C7B06_24180 [Escherichia coli]|nr:hypothetical protein C7B06_24180 [Escherichia coli]PSZ11974.1 hypothetical protein C7B07_23935 [Escherichia coli]
MLPLFKVSCFFCILLLGSGLIRGNNNLISPAVRQDFFIKKKQIHPYQKIDTYFSNDHLDFTYKSVDYSASAILQYIRKLIRKLYIK